MLRLSFLCLLIIVLCFTVEWPQSDRGIEHQTHVAGVSTNIGIQCPIPQSDGAVDLDIFWIINGSVYGLLQVPRDFRVCSDVYDPYSLRIPVVLSEMNGYIFQCVRVDFYNHTEQFLRDAAVLEVVEYNRNNTIQEATECDLLELSYPQSSVGAVNTTIGWTYSSLTCHPSVFTIQGYADRDAIQQDTPTLTLTSSSSVLTFPTNITNGSLYWRLLAHEEAGTPCAQDSALKYYYLDTNDTTPIPISPSSDGIGCVPIPVGPSPDYSSLEVVWPERRDTVGRLCYCPPFEGEQHLFSRCISTTSCDTDYNITVSNGSVCFAGLSPPLTSIPVYFTLLESCVNEKCILKSILTQFIIDCRSSNMSTSTPSMSTSRSVVDGATTKLQNENTTEDSFPYLVLVAIFMAALIILLLLSFPIIIICYCCISSWKTKRSFSVSQLQGRRVDDVRTERVYELVTNETSLATVESTERNYSTIGSSDNNTQAVYDTIHENGITNSSAQNTVPEIQLLPSQDLTNNPNQHGVYHILDSESMQASGEGPRDISDISVSIAGDPSKDLPPQNNHPPTDAESGQYDAAATTVYSALDHTKPPSRLQDSEENGTYNTLQHTRNKRLTKIKTAKTCSPPWSVRYSR